MALINGIIPEQNYELIGNAIGAILTVELENQGILQGATFVNSVFRERFIPPDETEFPTINVSLGDGIYDNKQQTQADGYYKFFIIANTSAKTTPETRGDKAATLKLHRLLGLCRAILENPVYNNLGFTRPFVKSTHVGSIVIPKTDEPNDATNSIMGYLEFFVKIPETVLLKDPIPLGSSLTVVKLYLTDNGYRYGPTDGDIDFFIAENSTADDPVYFIAE